MRRAFPSVNCPVTLSLLAGHYTQHTRGEGKAMKYAKPTLKRLGSLSELTLTSPSCDYQHDNKY